MKTIIARSHGRDKLRVLTGPGRGASGVLLSTQLMFNIGFYAVVPFIATVLSEDFALGGAAVGLVLGVRTFSQQGVFLLGGLLSDRFGAKVTILIGCAVRCLGFFTLAASLWTPEPSLSLFVVGTILTGLGGALFSPALSTLVAAAEARRVAEPRRRVTLFAWLTVFGETGAALGPLLGSALLGWGFATTALTGAALFLFIGFALWMVLPRMPPRTSTTGDVLHERGGAALRDRRFVLFAVIHAVDLFAYNQLYLSFPTELQRTGAGAVSLALIFTWVSILTVTMQIPVARWSSRFTPATALRTGYLSSAFGFGLLAVSVPWQPPPGLELAPAFLAVTFLTFGHLLAQPTAMHAVAGFAGSQRTGSYFGLLATTGGVLVLVGNVAVGSLLENATTPQPAAALPWVFLAALPVVAAILVGRRSLWARAKPST